MAANDPMGLANAYGAGGAADALRQLIIDRLTRQSEERKAALAEREMLLKESEAKQKADYQNEMMKQLAEERTARTGVAQQNIANQIESGLEIGQRPEPAQSAALRTALRGNLLKTVPATPGGGLIESLSPDLKSGVSVQQPPLPAGDIYTGNEKQKTDAEKKILLGRLVASFPSGDIRGLSLQAEQAGIKVPPGFIEKPSASASTLHQVGPKGIYMTAEDALGQPAYHAPKEAATVVIQTVDEQGNQVSKIVPKTVGSSFQKGPNATVANRLASAKAVSQTGDDIVARLQDPAFAAAVGPEMGRVSRLRDFIGNPPPQFAELAGAIESYALANMGVHGMRSAQGAEQIKKLLDQHHTPESLIATIKGLNKFSEHFMQNEGRTSSSGPASTSTPTRVRYDINGNRIP